MSIKKNSDIIQQQNLTRPGQTLLIIIKKVLKFVLEKREKKLQTGWCVRSDFGTCCGSEVRTGRLLME